MDSLPIQILEGVTLNRGLMWDKIEQFSKKIGEMEGADNHKVGTPQSESMQKTYPLKQKIEGGIYTRELFMPKGPFIISMIHKQQHPSFLLKGKVSYLNDEGEAKTITAPETIFTQEGTQRIFYVHEDTNWCCVYRTDAKTFEEAEADVYTDNYRDLSQETINKVKELWQD